MAIGWCQHPELKLLPEQQVVLLHAPPGHGKRSQALRWYESWTGSKIWLRLSPADNDLATFSERLLEQLDAAPLRINREGDNRLVGVVLRHIRQSLPTDDCLLVLDNLHFLAVPELSSLLREMAVLPNLKLVACSQLRHTEIFGQPELHGQLCRIDASALRLNDRQILELILTLNTTADSGELQNWIAGLQVYYQGWPALWLLTLQLLQQGYSLRQIEGEKLNRDFSGFLIAEVLQHLPGELQDLLFSLCVLEQFDEPIAARVSGQDCIRSKLQLLQQRQLFLHLDAAGQRYFFAGFFRAAVCQYLARTDGSRLAVAYHAACQALLAEGDFNRAVQLVQTSNSRLMAKDWLRQAGWLAFQNARYDLLTKVFALLPKADIQEDPELAILYAWWLLEGCKESNPAEQFVAELSTARWPDATVARLDVLRGEIQYKYDRLGAAYQLAKRALPQLRQYHDLVSCRFSLAMSALWKGELGRAESQLSQVLPLAESRQQYHIGLASQLRLAQLYMFSGEPEKAFKQANLAKQQALARHLQADTLYDAVCRLGCEFSLWRGDAEQTEVLYREASALSKPKGDYWWLCFRALELGLHVLQGKTANKLAEDIEQRLQTSIYCRQWQFRARQSLQLAYIWWGATKQLRQLSAKVEWHAPCEDIYDAQDNLLSARIALLIAGNLPVRLLRKEAESLVQPHELSSPVPLLSRQLALLQFYHHWRANYSSAEAAGQLDLTSLPQAKSALGLIRLFLIQGYLWEMLLLGPDAVPLWLQIKPLLADSPDALKGLERLVRVSTAFAVQKKQLAEPPDARLTRREWQVLQAIGEGFSNDQIAAQQHVSLATVKTHINRVYGKLEIRSRTQARAVAAQLARKREIGE